LNLGSLGFFLEVDKTTTGKILVNKSNDLGPSGIQSLQHLAKRMIFLFRILQQNYF
jgi:hypothetical protein